MTRAVRHSSASDSHLTPAYVVEPARQVLGRIDLDPASSEFANRLVRADRIFTREDDGLVQNWKGRLFVNPPGGSLDRPTCGTRSSQALWWGRLASSWKVGDVEAAIFVGFSLELLQSAQGLEPAVPHPLDFPVCVPKKRIKFDVLADELIERLREELDKYIYRHGSSKKEEQILKRLTELEPLRGQRVSGDQPTHGNLVALLPHTQDQIDRFVAEFSKIGHVRSC